MEKITQFVENNLGLSTVVFCFAGLAFPYGARIPDETIIATLAILMFLSCFKITEPSRSRSSSACKRSRFKGSA